MVAGALTVALDLIFATLSSCGATDDREFARVLQRYAAVTLAAEYEQSSPAS